MVGRARLHAMTTKQANARTKEYTTVFKLLADHNRYRALALLMHTKGGMSVGDIAEALRMNHSATSHLLAVLHEKNIVSYHRKGREMRYEITKKPIAKHITRLLHVCK
jgi:DNA-binding transcriptional ArsR family regulator